MSGDKLLYLAVSLVCVLDGLLRMNAKWNTKYTEWNFRSLGLSVKTTPKFQRKSRVLGLFMIFLGLALFYLKVLQS